MHEPLVYKFTDTQITLFCFGLLIHRRASKHEAIRFVRGSVAPGKYQIGECFDVLSLLFYKQT
jgi:hypothetical protein